MSLIGKVPYKNHARRHVAGGSDPIPGLGQSGAGTLVETLFLDTKTGTVTSATSLNDGRKYLITVQGTYSVHSGPLALGTPESDAMFPGSMSGRTSSQVGLDAECVFADESPGGALNLGGHDDLFEINLGSGASHIEPDDGAHSTPAFGHFYKYSVTGQGSVATFSINDTPLTDNYGKLKITIQTVDASSGGAGEGSLLPDPTSEPDGDVLTISSGTPVWSTPAGGSPSGAAGGALDGTYPNPGIAASVAGNGLSESSNVLAVNVDSSTIEINTDILRVKDAGVTEAKLGLSDVTTADVSSTKHGFAPKSPADSTKFLDGSATPTWDTVKDSDLSTSDITTNDVSTSKHGFVPKAPNDTAKFLRGDGTWAAPGGGGGGASSLATDVLWDAKGDLAGGTGADAASKLTVGSNGKLLVAASGETTGLKWDTGYLGGLELVYKYTVAGSDKASIDTGSDTADAGTNDWTNGDVLEVWMLLRTDDAGALANPEMIVNNNTSSIYDRQVLAGSNTAASAGLATGAANWTLTCHGSGGLASSASSIEITIPNYTNTSFFKIGKMIEMTRDTTANINSSRLTAITYESTSAITRIKIAGAGSAKFKVGSQLLIYKRRNA